MFTKHHPKGNASQHFDDQRVSELISRYQAGDPEALAGIIASTQERAKTLIRFHGTARFLSKPELLSDVNWKLMRVVDRYDASKGSAFTFLSQVIMTTLCTSVTTARRNAHRYAGLDEDFARSLAAKENDRSVADDLVHKIKANVKTVLTNEREVAAQKWFVASFTDDGFAARRHQCANAAVAIYGLSHSRSREIFDLTMLELRRLLYDDLKRRSPIVPGQLYGTRSAWMARYQPLLSPAEFTKFVVLMRDLAPYLLLTIDPTNHGHRQDRNPAIGRKNLELILDGCPDAVPLFK
jgi:hypothetical protein